MRTKKRLTTIGIVVMVLAGSASIRIGLNANALYALAENKEQEVETVPPYPWISNQEKINSEIEKISNLAKILKKRETIISDREIEVDRKIAIMIATNEKLKRKIYELQTAEKQLLETIALADTAAENDLTLLTNVYENMKPKEAVPIFEEMMPEFAAGFLSRMRPDIAASILEGLNPNTAYSISVVMAGRNANVLKENQ